jgi:hypothetical protein
LDVKQAHKPQEDLLEVGGAVVVVGEAEEAVQT